MHQVIVVIYSGRWDFEGDRSCARGRKVLERNEGKRKRMGLAAAGREGIANANICIAHPGLG